MSKLYEALAEAFLAEGVDTQFALMGDGKKYSDYIATLQDHAESNKITFVATRKIISSSSLEVMALGTSVWRQLRLIAAFLLKST